MTGETADKADNVLRAKVGEWLSGIQATKAGLFDLYFIEGPENGGVTVNKQNADEVEADIRAAFGSRFPEFAQPIE